MSAPPKEFQALVKELQGKADVHKRFLDECTEPHSETLTDVRKLYQCFNAWVRDTGLRNTGTRDVFDSNLADILGPPERAAGVVGYKLAVTFSPLDGRGMGRN